MLQFKNILSKKIAIKTRYELIGRFLYCYISLTFYLRGIVDHVFIWILEKGLEWNLEFYNLDGYIYIDVIV